MHGWCRDDGWRRLLGHKLSIALATLFREHQGCSMSWHSEQTKVRCSNPVTAMVLSSTTFVRIISAPHAIQRIARTPITNAKPSAPPSRDIIESSRAKMAVTSYTGYPCIPLALPIPAESRRSMDFWCWTGSTDDEALRRLSGWQRAGQIRFKEDVLDGIERMPEGFLRLLSGKNFGKQIIKIV